MAEINPRLRAVLDLSVPEVREYSGRHEYDGKVQDLSPDGVRAGLGRAGGRRRGDGSADREPATSMTRRIWRSSSGGCEVSLRRA